MWCFQAFNEIGGYQELESRYPEARPTVTWEGNWTAPMECFIPRADAFHIFRDAATGDIPWPGVVLGLSTISLYYWCADQVRRQVAPRACGGRGLCSLRQASLPASGGAQTPQRHALSKRGL